ncbi:MAG: TonB-dependent receptor, partial [Undibacterium sp.]|nr:TonB-dependent receptor [Undibacterium sp.]
LDVTGTIPYFGTPLGQAFPKNKVTTNFGYKINEFGVDLRMRYIGEMTNRMAALFPGEDLTGVKGTYYWDLGGSYEFLKGMTIRAGINNLLNQQPRTYSPNVQSGTDPSTYDTIGRRYFVTASFVMK